MTGRAGAVLVVAALAMQGCGGSPPAATEPATRMGIHGMILFGDGRLIASHVPMFHTPHDAQLLLEVRVRGAGVPSSFADQLYTLQPERFSLDALRVGRLTRFRATVYRGNFEAGGVPIARDAVVEVARVLFDQPLVASAPPAPLTYLALGVGGDDVALVRILGGAPGFDHVVLGRFAAGAPPAADLDTGVRVSVVGARDAPAARLAQGQMVSVAIGDESSTVTVVRELSCLVGPEFMAACP